MSARTLFARGLALGATLAAACGAALHLRSVEIQAQGTGKTVWDGVFSAEQAARGETLFATHCVTCHAKDLSGGNGPGLAGFDVFMGRFETDTLNRIFTSMRQRMPAGNPGTLSETEYLDLVSFVLQKNGFPSGSDPLTAVMVGDVRIVRKEAPGEAPNLSLVHMVGCLTEASPNTWLVANASAPIVTKDPAASKDAALKEAEARAFGTGSVRLMLLTVPASAIAPHKGMKVEAKGLLIRSAAENRLNLTSLQPVGAACN